MVDTELLKNIIKSNDNSYASVARSLGLSNYGFSQKVSNKSQFTADELYWLCKILNLTTIEQIEKVFYVGEVKKKTLKTA